MSPWVVAIIVLGSCVAAVVLVVIGLFLYAVMTSDHPGPDYGDDVTYRPPGPGGAPRD